MKKKRRKVFFNTRVFGKFYFEIILNVGNCEIKNKKANMKGKNGIITFEFEIEDKAVMTEFKV